MMNRLIKITLFLWTANCNANVTMFEKEPNNKPLLANNILAPVSIMAEMTGSDQDLYVWEINDADAGFFWDIELRGLVGSLTKLDVMQLEFTEDGNGVAAVNKIFSLTNSDGLIVKKKLNLVFTPGKYYFGLSYASGGTKGLSSTNVLSPETFSDLDSESIADIKKNQPNNLSTQIGYGLNFIKRKKIYALTINKDNSKEKPAKFSKQKPMSVYYQVKSRWLQIKIDEKGSQNKWKLNGHASIGNKIQLKLYNQLGQVLAETHSDSDGYYHLTDLHFSTGVYLLELKSRYDNTLTSIQLSTIGEIVAGSESEPNDKISRANIITVGEKVSGRVGKKNEYDYFKFVIDEELSSKQLVINFTNHNSTGFSVCLLDQNWKTYQCRNKKADINFSNIALASGEYGLSISKGTENSEYSLSIQAKGKRKSINEAEPNDIFKNAVPMNAKRIIKGQFDGQESDFFKFEVAGEPQLWTVQANGNNIQSMTLFNSAGKIKQDFRYAKTNKRARLSNLFLMPGTHVVSLKGKDGKYLLRAFPAGKPDLNFEMEPNDNVSTSSLLKFGQEKKGLLENNLDQDFYHFHLDSDEYIKLAITPPIDGSIIYQLYWFDKAIGTYRSEIGQEMIFKGIYPVGDYKLTLKTGLQPSEATYAVKLMRLPVANCRMDCEPNDSVFQAEKIASHYKLQGFAGDHKDSDWYRLPIFNTETQVAFASNIGDQRKVRLTNAQQKDYPSSWDKVNKYYQFIIPANEESFVKIAAGDKPYDYDMLVNGQKSKVLISENPLNDIKITFSDFPKNIKSYYQHGQSVDGKVIITNTTSSDLAFKIDSSSNYYSVKMSLNSKQLNLKAGKSIYLPLIIQIPDDINSNQIVRATVKLTDDNGNEKSKGFDLQASSDVNAVNPQLYWPIDQLLLGGINVASYAMGAKRTTADIEMNKAIGTRFDTLFDGYVMLGNGMRYRGGRKNKQDYITIDLAGDNAHDIIGMMLNPLSSGSPRYYPKDVELQLSTDGVDFQSVLNVQLKPIGKEQAFVLVTPVKAKFARLYIHNSFADHERAMYTLGEWKVIAKPSSKINNNNGYNIADPKHGGNVIWASPQTSIKWDKNLITETKEKTRVRSKNKDDWQWVIGFHHQRAALIDKIQLLSPALDGSKKSFKKVQIMVSIDSPVGPWKEVLSTDISKTSLNNEFIFEQPIWARYVKFNVGDVKTREYRYTPETIRIFEHPADSTYQSVLGEWGEDNQLAIYEIKHPVNFIQKSDDDKLNNHQKSTAFDLTTSQEITGQVQLEYADKPDWYKFKLPNGQNTLKLTLSGEPTVKTVVDLEDATGQAIALFQEDYSHKKIVYSAQIEAEKYYYIRVAEPPRSVVFTWDTSGSTSSYQPLIYRALSQYTQGVVAGRDEVNFLPFGGELLMKQWNGEPYRLKTILNNYSRKDNSSKAESTLEQASKSLEKRQGSKSIVVFTDAVTTKDAKVWDSFKNVQPQVFSIGIIASAFGGEPTWQVDLMQAWSRVNNGEFHKVNSSAEVEVAFERVIEKLRQPANYSLNLASVYERPLDPGTLNITQNQQTSSNAVELILDASGSMLRRLDGKRRINIAKEVLINTVTKIIPPLTPLALRVFGDKQANSCRTDLAIKLQPLEPISAKAVIEKIHAKNLAKTPIADSLAKVATDLKAHKGKKIVILVTDGKETCDGNPEEVIASLIDQGIDLRFNIVGFAIDDEELKAQFNQWSTQGGGKYFDSNNPESLKQSIAEAFKTPYSVYSLSGELIKEGTVNGEPLELPVGYYNIKIFGSEVKSYDKYQIKGEVEQLIEL